MIAARQISRCASCRISILNSLVSTRATPIRILLGPGTSRLQTGVLARRRRFHASVVRFEKRKGVEGGEGVGETLEPMWETVAGAAEEFKRIGAVENVLKPGEEPLENDTSEPEGIQGSRETEAVERCDVIATIGLQHEHGELVSRDESEVRDHPDFVKELDKATRPEKSTLPALGNIPAEVSGVPEIVQSPAEATTVLPWYLRVKAPHSEFHPLARRQEIPPLPENPPPALEAVLTRLSTEEGINDLKVLDLRSLDPAPALGEGTVMIIGTARSVQQLQMCADRVCRWLRKEHGMRPFADGLDGRNLLRLQEKRARKRGKLTSAQSGIAESAGWVCVIAGSQGLVIELFTPKKREEIDLESLWGKELERDSRKRDAEMRIAAGKERETFGAFERGLSTNFPLPGAGIQTRSFHSCRRSLDILPETPVASQVGFKKALLKVETHVRKGHYWRLVPYVSEAFDPDTDPENAALLMESHINNLRNQFRGNNLSGKLTGGCKLLGKGMEDRTSTRFLQSYFRYLPQHRAPIHTRLHLQFLIEANRINPGNYPLSPIIAFLKQLPPPVPVELYYICMRAIADSPEHRSYKLRSAESSALRLSLVQDLIDHFDPTSTVANRSPEFQFCEFRALADNSVTLVLLAAKTVCAMKRAEADKEVDSVFKKLNIKLGIYPLDPRLVELGDASTNQENHSYAIREYIEQAMATYVASGSWAALWSRWRNLKYMGVQRDQGFYELIIGLVVMGQKQKEAVYAARHLWNDMSRERPKVELTAGTARGLLALIQLAERDSGASGEFIELKARCECYLVRWRKWRDEMKAKGGSLDGNGPRDEGALKRRLCDIR